MFNSNKKILLLGGSSFIGRHFITKIPPQKTIATYYRTPFSNGKYFDSTSMDLSQIIEEPRNISHAVIFLGDTDPDSCATDIKKSYHLNVTSILKVIDYLIEWRIKAIFISSEFVFDGNMGNYTESDHVNPILTYGKQKVEVEKYIQNKCKNYIIARFPKVFGSDLNDGTLFSNWLNVIERQDPIKCAVDQIFSPTYVSDIIDSLIKLIQHKHTGIFHVANKKSFSRIELLQMLLAYVNEHKTLKTKIIPCSIHDFNLKEKRPLNVSLNSNKLRQVTGIEIDSVEKICREIVRIKFNKNENISFKY